MTDEFEQPHIEVDRDRFGRYMLPDQNGQVIPWTRVTTLARTLTDEYQLNQWRVRQVVRGMGLRRDLYALAASTHLDDKKTLQEIGDKAQAAADSDSGANLGRALHTFSQRLDGGAKIPAPPEYIPYLLAYQEALRAAGLAIVPALMERIVISPEIPAAGQFDRLLQPTGVGMTDTGDVVAPRLVIGDLKTAKLDSITYAWLEISIQLATYAHATKIWEHAEKQYRAMPDVDLARAIVMHLPQDLPPTEARCDIYEIDIVKGWECALIAKEVRTRRSEQKSLVRLLQSHGTGIAEKVAEVRPTEAQRADQVFEELRASRERATRVTLETIHTIPGESREHIQELANGVMALAPLVPGGAELAARDLAESLVTVQAPPSPLDRIRAASSRADLSALWRELSAAGQWSPELEAAGKARLAAL